MIKMLCAAAVAFSSLPAMAADIAAPDYRAPVPGLYYDWTGLYVGGNIGGMWTHGSLTETIAGLSFTNNGTSGLIGGAQIGYNWQISNFVVGFEWDGDWASLSGKSTTATSPNFGVFTGSAGTNWVTSFAGRLGVAVDHWLIYGKAGGGFVNSKATITSAFAGTWNANNTSGGWLLGAGVEYAFTPNWTVKLEYDYLRISDWNAMSSLFSVFNVTDQVTLTRDIQLVKLGVNYRFTWGSPVAVRY
jgi:outer membrane immunogenic protein